MSTSQTQSQPRKKKPQRYNNPLQRAVHSYLSHYGQNVGGCPGVDVDIEALTASIPKRYNIYQPLLLLPAHFMSATPAWKTLVSSLNTTETIETLCKLIVQTFKSQGVTHIALNSPILRKTPDGMPNMKRSPINLTPLYGDFGPHVLRNEQTPDSPSESDFQAAFWISTTQNDDIVQTWAPLWTMFSRGNASEKARILGRNSSAFGGLDGHDGVLGQHLREISVVDMYIGIGYFAFSYLRRGVGRLWGWEVNGWSIEGLRRGCRKNGWGIRVLKVDGNGIAEDQEGRRDKAALGMLASELGRNDEIRMVAFWGDNRWARSILESIKLMVDRDESAGRNPWLDIRHVNLGLLPSSRLAWEDAVDMLDAERGGWTHIHENVDIREIAEKRNLVIAQLREHGRASKEFSCRHIEQVKTYAPGVMHCVFDVHVEPQLYSKSAGRAY